jgi:hypothetical protein
MTSTYRPRNHAFDHNNHIYTNPQQKTNLLAEHFEHVLNCEVPNMALNNEMYMQVKVAIMSEENEDYNSLIKMEELEQAVKKLKKTSPGIDQVDNQFLMRLPDDYKIYCIS